MVLTTLDPKTALVVIDLQKASLLSLKCTRSRKSSSTRASWRRRSAAMACRLCSSMSAVHPRDARSRCCRSRLLMMAASPFVRTC